MKTEFYNEKKYEVFEAIRSIEVYKKCWFGLLSWYASYDKEYYSYEFDTTMHMIKEVAQDE